MAETMTAEQIDASIEKAVEARAAALIERLEKAEAANAALQKTLEGLGEKMADGASLQKAAEVSLKEIREVAKGKLATTGNLTVNGLQRLENGGFRTPDQAKDFGLGVFAYVVGNPEAKALCEERGLEWKTMTGSDGASGGALIPQGDLQELQIFQQQFGVMQTLALPIPMPTNEVPIPKLKTGFTAYHTAEGFAPTAQDLTFEMGYLRAKGYDVLSYAAREFVEDAAIAVGQLVFLQMALAFAKKEDDNAINGDGTSTYASTVGLISSIGAAGVVTAASGQNTFEKVKPATLKKTVAALPDNARANARWLMNSSLLVLFEGIEDNNGRPILTERWAQPGFEEPFLVGYPVSFANVLPASTAGSQASKVCALFGDFRLSIARGDRRQVTLEVSTQYKFAERLITFLGTQRVDYHVIWPGDATDPGGYVALKTAAS